MRLSLEQPTEHVLQNILHAVTAACHIESNLLGIIEISTYDILKAFQDKGLLEFEFLFKQDLRRLEFNFDFSTSPNRNVGDLPTFFNDYFGSEQRSYIYSLIDGMNYLPVDKELLVYYNLGFLSEDVYTQRVMLLRSYFSLNCEVMAL
jgi:hypothetical protein